MKKIAIIAATFYGNRGAEGMLSTTIGKLREAYGNNNVVFNIFSYYPQSDNRLVDDDYVRIYSSTPIYLVLVLLPGALLFRLLSFLRLTSLQRLLPQSVNALEQSNVLICLAGVSFIEGREKFLPFNIATILPAMLLNVPVVKFSQAVGPFKSFINRISAQLLLGRCKQIFSRGDKTHYYLQDLFGQKQIYQRANDIAFLFRPEFCVSLPANNLLSKLSILHTLQQDGKIIIGVCPSIVIAKRAKKDGWDYQKFMLMVVQQLAKRGFVIAIYPNATRGEDMDKTHNNDLPLIDTLCQMLTPYVQKGSVVVFSDSYNAAQIHQIINACNIQVVSRFHAMIASLVCKIPVMVLGWSHKYMEVMALFQQEDMVLDYKKSEIEDIIGCVEKLVLETKKRSSQITNALPVVQKSSNKQIQYILQLLN